jgi:hypothetical protein
MAKPMQLRTEKTNMKRSFRLPLAFMLVFCTVIAVTGCDSAIINTADTAALYVNRSALLQNVSGSGDLETITITGPIVVVDGAFAVLYQGSPWYVKGVSRLGLGLAEGEPVTITGKAAPILDRDNEGNSLFFGYYLQAENISVN